MSSHLPLQMPGLTPNRKASGVPGHINTRGPGPFTHSSGLPTNPGRRNPNVDPNPQYPINRVGFTVPASAQITLELTDCRTIYFAEAIKFGTGVGDLSIQFGETGDPILLSPGDLVRCSGFRRVKLFNNTAVAKSGAFLVTADPLFEWKNYPRGA